MIEADVVEWCLFLGHFDYYLFRSKVQESWEVDTLKRVI